MQAVILWTLGTSWPHSRKASPVHICCASDEKAGSGRTESAVAAEAMAMKSAILLVRWKVIDAFPKVARGAGRYSLGALHAACAAARVIHHREVTRCGCSISADVESKVLRRPVANYAPMLRSCNGLRQHFPKLLRARHVERSERCATNAVLTLAHLQGGFRRRNGCGSLVCILRTRSNGRLRDRSWMASGYGRCPARLRPAGRARLPRRKTR